MTDCEKICELLPEYLNGGLSREERGEVARHLAVCRDCRSEAAFLIRLKKASESLFSAPGGETGGAFDRVPELADEARRPGSEVIDAPLSEAFETLRSAAAEVSFAVSFAFSTARRATALAYRFI